MTGTPSRTATAFDGGVARHSVGMLSVSTPQGFVERKLKAKLRSEAHESHLRQSCGGRDCVAGRSPMSSGAGECICGGYVERRSHVLPREICLFAVEAEIRTTAREAERSTKGRQKSAESASCQRTAA
jgi:hypothetical protein